MDEPLLVLVDDVREFRDGRPCRIARTTQQAIELIDELYGQRIDELWLDYDMGGGATVQPFVEELVRRADEGVRPDIGRVFVHTSSVTGATYLMQRLTAAGYDVERHRTMNFWTW